MSEKNQFYLLSQKRFSAYFYTQLLGAFNDNVFKNALIVLITFSAIGNTDNTYSENQLLINLAAGLFIIPFFIFSAIAGQLADKFEQAKLIQRIKFLEIFIMLFAVLAFISGNIYFLLAILFLMGTQSAFFGPVKYGILPQYLSREELLGGNGLVEMGTFLAILLGTIIGTKVAVIDDLGIIIICVIIIVVAILGYIISKQLPHVPACNPDLIMSWNPFTQTIKAINMARVNRSVFLSILGISWFWFLGATYLAQFPTYAKHVLGGDVDLFTLLLATFSIGIGIGSALCEKLSGRQVEIGLVPFGALGLTLFGLDLSFASPSSPWGQAMGLGDFFSHHGSIRLTLDIFLIGLFGGFFIVPLYALVQQRSDDKVRARIISANNILNALFMVGSALFAITLLSSGVDIKTLFLVVAIMNAAVALYIFTLVPEFLMRFLTWLLIHTIYRVRVKGLQNIPEEGAVILACNHVSFVDPLIVGGSIRRPVRFVMDHKIHKLPVLNFIFTIAKTIPIASKRDNPEILEKAYIEMEKALKDGDVLCIFPEGKITYDGNINTFRPGIKRLIESHPVAVIPMALQNLYGSLFSRSHSFRLPRKLFAKIDLVIDKAISPEALNMQELQDKVTELRGSRL